MTPAEHQEAAERYLLAATASPDPAVANLWALVAQVHATLATIPSDRVLTARDDR